MDTMKTRQVINRPNQMKPTSYWTSPQTPRLPQKVSRVRSFTTLPLVGTRKRTSSGVFQVDESEPLAKKLGIPPSPAETPRPGAAAGGTSAEAPKPRAGSTNGRKKTETADTGKNQSTPKKKIDAEKKKENIIEKVEIKKVVEKFDSQATSNCVSAFKESDSWD